MGYAKQAGICIVTAGLVNSEGTGVVDKGDGGESAACEAGSAAGGVGCQAVRRKERADRERRLEGLAVAVLTAIGERDGAVRDAERRAEEALRTMTDHEGWHGPLRVNAAGRLTMARSNSPAQGSQRTTFVERHRWQHWPKRTSS